MPLTDDDVREILRIVDSSPLREIRVQTDGFSLHVVKEGGKPEPEPEREPQPEPEAAPEPESPAAPRTRRDLVTIEAPMLGIFYGADGPGERPFVEVGSRVQEHTTVAIIEVMKMMNSVPAGVNGTVVEICAENAAMVEEGAALFRVDPS
jgi:acetyl-CoA carboxylase biotin carboxyl carrier protein